MTTEAQAVKPVYTDVRDAFFEVLYERALTDRNLVLLVADQGALTFEKFKQHIPKQFMNLGISEQNVIGVAAGLALKGKRVVAHAIIPFITLRCFEQIRVDLCCPNLPVTLVGVGAGYAYSTEGPTHHAVTDIAAMRSLPNMQVWNPSDHEMIASLVPAWCAGPGPKYVRLDKGAFPAIYESDQHDFSEGVSAFRTGSDLTIVATGVMVHQALTLAHELERHAIHAGVVDLYRIKPVNEQRLLELLRNAERIVTLEENSLIGGIGSLVAELLADHGWLRPLKRLALSDRFRFELGSRERLQALDQLDLESLVATLVAWMTARS